MNDWEATGFVNDHLDTRRSVVWIATLSPSFTAPQCYGKAVDLLVYGIHREKVGDLIDPMCQLMMCGWCPPTLTHPWDHSVPSQRQWRSEEWLREWLISSPGQEMRLPLFPHDLPASSQHIIRPAPYLPTFKYPSLHLVSQLFILLICGFHSPQLQFPINYFASQLSCPCNAPPKTWLSLRGKWSLLWLNPRAAASPVIGRVATTSTARLHVLSLNVHHQLSSY